MRLCCGVKFTERNWPRSDICFKTRHTTDTNEVHYFKQRYEEDDYGYGYSSEEPEERVDEEGINFDGRNEQVVTCRRHGCFTRR